MPTPEESPQRTLLAAIGAMVGVALVVGLAVAGIILAVVSLSGVGGDGEAEEAAPATMFIPDPEPTGAASPGTSGGTASPSPTRSASPRAITLKISPREGSPGERLDLTGTYRGGDGASLQVQRRDGDSWIDFPVTATVQDERFSTYIITSRPGTSTFRVVDRSKDRGSNTVRVTLQ